MKEKNKNTNILLPSVEDAGIIAIDIAELADGMTTQEQAFFVAGFQECVKYLKKQTD